MKKILSIFIAVALCLSTAIPLTLFATNGNSEPIKAHLFVSGVQSGKALSEVSGLYYSDWCKDVTSQFTGVDSLVTYTNEPSVKFDNANIVNNYSWENQCTFNMNKKVINGSSFIFYVKVPDGQSHELFFVAASGYDNGNGVRQTIKAGESYQLLDKNKDSWEQKTVKPWDIDDDDGIIDIPAGFEGYVKIPVDTLYNDSSKKDEEKLSSTSPIDILGLRISNYGGSMGAAYVGPIMVQENNSDSTLISLDGAEAVKMAKDKPISAHLAISGVVSGKSLTEQPLVFMTDWNEDATTKFTGVDSMVGFTNEPTIKMDNSAVVDDYSWNEQLTMVMNGRPLAGTDIIFYIKTPKGQSHELFFIANAQGDPRQNIKSGEPYYLLASDKTSWEKKSVKAWADDDTDGLLELPDGFEGFVKVPVNTLYSDPDNKENEVVKEDSPIYYLGFRLTNFGGDLGPAYVGPIVVSENSTDSTEISLDGANAVSLLTKPVAPISAHLLVDNIKEGEAVPLQNEGGVTSFTGIKSLVSYDDHAAMQVSSTDNITALEGKQQASFNFNYVKLNGEGLLMYIEASDTGTHDMYVLVSHGWDYKYWPRIKTGQPYQSLSLEDGVWEDKTFEAYKPGDTDGKVVIPSGFKGYIRIPFSGMYQNSKGAETPTADSNIMRLGLRFTNYGGDLGDIKVGPIMVDENMSNSTKLSLDGADAVTIATPKVENPVNAHLLVSNIEVGKAVSLHGEGGNTTFTGVESQVDYDDHAAMEIANAGNIIALDGKQQASFDFSNVTLGGQAFLFYLKTSDASEHALYLNGGTQNGSYWPRIKTDMPYQTLADTDTSWQNLKFVAYSDGDADGKIVLPAGFSGYIRVPFSSMYQNNPDKDVITPSTTLNRLAFRCANYGKDYGTITVGPIMIDENLSDSTNIRLNYGKVSKMQQKVSSSTKEGLQAEIISRYETLAVGDDITSVGYGSTSKDVTLTAVNSQVGYTDYPAIKATNKDGVSISADKLGNADTYFYNSIYQPLSESSDIMFYVKMPNKANKVFLVVETNTDGSTTPTSWPRVEAGNPYSILAKGNTTWTSKTATTQGTDGFIELDAGFEGYVKVPLSSITWASQNVVVDSSYYITRLLFRFSDFGGTDGEVIMGPYFKVTQDADKATAYINNSDEEFDLFAPTKYDPSKPLLNFQAMSDSHIDDYGGGAVSIGARHTVAALKDISSLHADTNAILHGGDLTENGSPAQYAQSFGYFSSLSPTKNVLITMGNHDIRGNLSTEGAVSYDEMVARFTKYNKAYSGTDKPYYDKWINGYHFIVLCTDEKLKDESILHEDQMNWLQEKVREGASSNKPIFIMTHDPIEGTFCSDVTNTTQPSDEIKDLMKQFPQIVMFTGHLHTIDTDNVIISEGKGIFLDMPSLHNDNRPVDPTDAFHNMYYNVNVYTDRVDFELYDYEKKENVRTYSIKTSDFAKVPEGGEEEPKDTVMKADNFEMLTDVAVGDVIKSGTVNTHYGATEVNKTAVVTVVDSANAAVPGKSLKIDSDKSINRVSTADQTQFDINPANNVSKSMKKGKAFVLYVKMPTGDNGTGTNCIFFNVQHATKGGGQQGWNNLPKNTFVKYLAKGTNEWKTYQVVDDGTIVLPAGFEGYIYAPFANLIDGNYSTSLDNTHYLQHFGVSVGYLGGEYGAFYFAPVLMTTNDVLSKDGVMMAGSDKITNLFSGAQMSEDEVYEDPYAAPKLNTLVEEIPTATTDKVHTNEIEESDVTGTTVKLSWEAFAGAKQYRVDVYKSEFSGSVIAYRYVANSFTTDTFTTITGLNPSTKYFFVVNALDADGKNLAIYEEQSVSTQYVPTTGTGSTTTPTTGDTDTPFVPGAGDSFIPGGESGNPLAQTGNNWPIGVSLMLICSLGFAGYFRKRICLGNN